jgi:hypothetical protein
MVKGCNKLNENFTCQDYPALRCVKVPLSLCRPSGLVKVEPTPPRKVRAGEVSE